MGVDKGPAFENETTQAIFFMLFILIGSFFFLNFVIGILFLEFNHAKKQEEKGYTKPMLTWVEIQSLILSASCNYEMLNMPPIGTLRHRVWRLVTSKPFDYGIMICIVMNMCSMALSYEGASETWESFLEITNYIFTAIFLAECILKLIAYKKAYFSTNWNRFDFFVVVSSLIDIGLKFMPQSESADVLTVGP